MSLVCGFAVGLDLTRRDLQAGAGERPAGYRQSFDTPHKSGDCYTADIVDWKSARSRCASRDGVPANRCRPDLERPDILHELSGRILRRRHRLRDLPA
jgi:hypothetical protein